MSNEAAEFRLPPAPRGLCFDRNDFVKTIFSVDNFLVDHQNVASLETMRDDLGIYLKVLRLAMIELINKDYANFVNLCATLIGFDNAIVKIQVPLGQLNEEVIGVKQCLEDVMKELSLWLSQRHSLIKKKNILKYYSQTLNCLTSVENILSDISDKTKQEQIIIADRAAMKYNQLKFSISKCDNLIKEGQKKQYNDIGGKLVQTLNELLFQFWNDNNEDYLIKTLIALNTLDRVAETEMLIRKQAVAPLLQNIINEPALQRSKDGLEGVYKNILLLLENKLKLLLKATQHSKLTFLAKQYRFLVNCFWCEVENRLEVNLASIFAPGNPQLFYIRYSESMHFIKMLEQYCSSDETIKMLHDTPEYKSFFRRWNLPVYFQIRFQEIAGGFEASLNTNPTMQKNDCFILLETYKCWSALQDCWSAGIYIEALNHKFWKLSLQLLSRYATWITNTCSPTCSSKMEITRVNKKNIDNSINLYVDSSTLIERLPKLLENVENKVLNLKSKVILRDSLRPTEKLLNATKTKICESIVNDLFEFINSQLKQVSDIPRLYRKTNRSVPTSPCTYIDVITRTINEFNEDATERLDNTFLMKVYDSLFNVMTVSYYKYVEDVLVSVQKTEESLRRLKQIRDLSSQQNSDSTGTTDGDKIRLQLNVDVVTYARLVESLLVNDIDVHKLSELSAIVRDAVKNINIK